MTDIQPIEKSSARVRGRAVQRPLPPTFQQQLAIIAQRCGGQVVFLHNGDVSLTGTPGVVGQLIAVSERTGRLVAQGRPMPVGGDDRVLVNVRLVPRVQPHAVRQAAPRRKLPRWAFWSIIGAVIAFVGGLGWLVYKAVNAILANLAAASVVAIAVAVVIAAVVGNRSGGGKTFSGTFQGKID